MVELLLALLGLGIAGLDPLGALIVAAALAAGSTRRAVSAFLVASTVTTVAVGGLLGRAIEPLLSSLGNLLNFPDAVWVAINILLVAVLVWALARFWRRQDRADRSDSEPKRRAAGLSTWSLAGAGVLFGLSMLTDPTYYAIIALGTRVEGWLVPVLVVALWYLISQSPLFVVVASSFLGLHEQVAARLQDFWARSKPYVSWIIKVAILLAVVVLVADTLHFFIRGEFMIG